MRMMFTTRPVPDRTATSPRLSSLQKLLLVQGTYYLLAGLWAILDIHSFQLVTGPKTDLWLVRTVAVLVVAVAGSLLLAARKPDLSAETAFLAVSTALGLTAIDIIFVIAGDIPAVYLLDAAAEILFLGWWAWEASNRLDQEETPN
jgi:hypothetical protein